VCWGFGFSLLIISCILFEKGSAKKIWRTGFFISFFLIFCGAALLDPYINWWDEQFHSLVGKHMLEDPLHPVLIKDPVLPYDYQNWTGNHTWLHKQPLFLWQIGASIAIFGKTAFAVRFPAIVMMSILGMIIIRMGTMWRSERTGIFAAVLFATSYTVFNIVSGFLHTDQNDVAFLFYVTLSIWAWMEYHEKKTLKWVLFVGLFSGCAILVKWLTGLLVYAGWGIVLIAFRNYRINKMEWRNYFIALFTTVFIALPWQIYTRIRFPQESAFETAQASRHFSEPMEGHDGTWVYHFDLLQKLYFPLPLMPALLVMLFLAGVLLIRKNEFKIMTLSSVVIVFAFFTLAATKMPVFTFIIAPLIYLSVAILIEQIYDLFRSRLKLSHLAALIIPVFLLSFLSYKNMHLTDMLAEHGNDRFSLEYRIQRKKDMEIYKNIHTKVPSNSVLFNCRPGESAMAMFYSEFTAYEAPTMYEHVKFVAESGRTPVIFKNNETPDSILNIPGVVVIEGGMW
jgi:hypothetical protein